MVYIKREPGQIHKDIRILISFMMMTSYLRQRQKIHLTLYESRKVITYQAFHNFFLKLWYIQIQKKKKRDGKNTTTNTQTKKNMVAKIMELNT